MLRIKSIELLASTASTIFNLRISSRINFCRLGMKEKSGKSCQLFPDFLFAEVLFFDFEDVDFEVEFADFDAVDFDLSLPPIPAAFAPASTAPITAPTAAPLITSVNIPVA